LAGAIADMRPLLVVGGVDVEEVGGGASRSDVVRDGLGEGQRRLAVEVDTEDAHAQAAELPRRRGAEAAGGAEDEAPPALERTPGIHGGAPSRKLVGAASLRYVRRVGGKGDRPTVENRWWVDQGKDATGRPIERPPAQFGGRFFRTGEGFEQERAQRRLTDSNLKWLEEANPPADGWAIVHMFPGDQFPVPRFEKIKASLRLPSGGRGVLIDSGNSVRAIMTGLPAGERLVEVRLADESSFAAWILWGVGLSGAPALRVRVAEQDAQLLERKNRQVDIEGKLTVCQGRLDECNRSLAAKSAAAAQQPAAP